jgi:putative transposase
LTKLCNAIPMSSRSRVCEFARGVSGVFVDVLMFLSLSLRPLSALAAENLFLRKQLGLYVERKKKPCRATDSVRFTLVQLARFFEWRSVLTVVKPDTLVRWHRKGFRLFWKCESHPSGRPRVPLDLRKLIVHMASNNPTWGEERIANELLLKIGIQISPRTVRRYMPDRPDRPKIPSQRWMTFVRNHAKAIIATDFFVVVTATFRFVYVLVVMEIETRRILHLNVTRHPTAEWTMQQFRECVIGDEGYRFVIHDRDSIYSSEVDCLLRAFGLRVLKTPYRAPQANAFCERLIGSARRECLDFMIPINEDHVRGILKQWTAHYNKSRPHSSLGPGIPDLNAQKMELQRKRHCMPKDHCVAVTPILGGLQHEYRLQKIAA